MVYRQPYIFMKNTQSLKAREISYVPVFGPCCLASSGECDGCSKLNAEDYGFCLEGIQFLYNEKEKVLHNSDIWISEVPSKVEDIQNAAQITLRLYSQYGFINSSYKNLIDIYSKQHGK